MAGSFERRNYFCKRALSEDNAVHPRQRNSIGNCQLVCVKRYVKIVLSTDDDNNNNIYVVVMAIVPIWLFMFWRLKINLCPPKLPRGPKGHITCTWVQCATFLMDWPGRPFLYTNQSEKHKKLVEDVEILLPVKFRLILFSSLRGKVENGSANKRPGRPSCFPDRPKNTYLVEDVAILLPVKFRWILFSSFRGEVENVKSLRRRTTDDAFGSGALKQQKLLFIVMDEGQGKQPFCTKTVCLQESKCICIGRG